MVGDCTLRATLTPESTLVCTESITPDRPEYQGPYEVMPAADAQVLATKGRVMSSDVNVAAIPYYEVTNPQGGSTFIIGRTNDYTE